MARDTLGSPEYPRAPRPSPTARQEKPVSGGRELGYRSCKLATQAGLQRSNDVGLSGRSDEDVFS